MTTPPGPAAATLQGLLDDARQLAQDTVDLRRRIHRRPETGLANPETQDTVLRAIDGLGLEVQTGRATTSVVATLDGARPGPTILLRGDMDALPMPEDTGLDYASQVPGAMHACGHDAHVAMLVGAARLLSARRDRIAGRVLFMFQPGEEGHHGARVMIEEGVLDGPRPPVAAFALHTSPQFQVGTLATRPGPLLAAADTLSIVIQGRGGHASAPHDCLDPIPIACEIVQAFQTMVTRRIDAFDPAVVTVTKIEGGTTRNVVPESARLLGTIRTVSERTRARVHDAMRRLAEGIAAAHGAAAEVEIIPGYPVTVNDAEFAAFALDTAAELVGAERVVATRHPRMGAEDFSYVLQRVPGAMVNLGTRPDGDGPVAPNHSNRMLLHEGALATGIAMHAAVALRYLDRAAGA
jgi:hippurate hydrolase